MTIDGEYEPSALDWVRDQVAEYEASGGMRANTLRDTGIPVIVVTMRGHRSGKVRKIALMRVEHGGADALVAPYGGSARNPGWYANLPPTPTSRSRTVRSLRRTRFARSPATSVGRGSTAPSRCSRPTPSTRLAPNA